MVIEIVVANYAGLGLFFVPSYVLWNACTSNQWQYCRSGLLFRGKSRVPVQSWFSPRWVRPQLSDMSGIWEVEPY